MRRVLRLRSARVCVVLSALVALGLTSSPLAGVQGVESALVLGVVLPFFGSLVGARLVVDAQRTRARLDAGAVVGGSVVVGVLLAGVPSLVLGLNAWISRSCASSEGFVFLAMGPGVGTVLAALCGAVLAAGLGRPRWATFGALLLPLVSVGFVVAEILATPGVFAFGQFFGWFPGTLYDENLGVTAEYATFRAASVALGAGLALLVVASLEPRTARMRVARLGRVPLASLGSLACLGLFAAAAVSAPALGHRSDVGEIQRRLGARSRGARCDVVAPRELAADALVRFRDDCDFRVEQMERVLGVHHTRRVTAFLFRSPDEKRQLMGAADTYVAKPWRSEVYLQVAEYPHPVLAHEIAHVIAGDAANGPFRVGGQLGGWIPDPILIEGIAVAMAWDGFEGLTPHQWARTMLEVDRLPRLQSIVGAGFLLESGPRAYTTAGSFLRFLLDTRGAPAVRRLYATGDFEGATGQPLDVLEAEWLDFLRQLRVPADAIALARARFARGGLFARPCPHRVAQLRLQLGGDLAAGDDARAAGTCREILGADPADVSTRALLVAALTRSGLHQEADRELAALETRWQAPRPVLARARELRADAAWRAGRLDTAASLYAALRDEPRARDDRRILEVKLLALREGGRTASLLREVLAPGPHAPDGAVLVRTMRELRAVRSDGLPYYLEARQMLQRERFEDALELLDTALERGLPTTLLHLEARDMQARSAFASGQLRRAERIFSDIAVDATLEEGDHVEARDWLARLAWVEAR